MESSTYQYNSLTGLDPIRLLVLRPSADIAADIHCSLLTTTFTKGDNDIIGGYTALSYVWGDEQEKTVIYIEDKLFEVTANLNLALRRIRDPLKEQLLWIDAVCINQSDSHEKSQQVVQMGRVYQTARHTIIYLGESTKLSELLLRVIQRSCNQSLDRFTLSEKDILASISNGVDDYSSSCIELATNSFLDILERPWFTRVWVLQELVFSKSPWIQCGQLRVRWEQFYDAFKTLSISHVSFSKPSDALGRFVAMNHRREIFKPTLNPSSILAEDLLKLLISRKGLGVTDPRDMFFAHIGILQGFPVINLSNDGALMVDYSKRVQDVYADLTRYCITTSPDDRKLEALSYVEGYDECGNKETELNLPSWTPDWTLKSFPSPHRRLREMTQVAGCTMPKKYHRMHRRMHHRMLYRYLIDHLSPYLWHKSSFICSGWYVRSIEKVSSIITPCQADWKMSRNVKLSSKHKTSTEELRILSTEELLVRDLAEFYNNWRDVIEPLYYDPTWPTPISVDFNRPEYRPQPLISMFTKPGLGMATVKHIAFILSGLFSDLRRTAKTSKYLETFGKMLSSANLLGSTLSIILWEHAASVNSEKDYTIFSEVLYNRRFAALDDKTLALVPATAKVGDVVCFLAADLTTPFVLRPNSEKFADLEEGYRKRFRDVLEKPDYTYSDYTFVGECHIDTKDCDQYPLVCHKSIFDVIEDAHSKRIRCYVEELSGRLDDSDTRRRLEIFSIS